VPQQVVRSEVHVSDIRDKLIAERRAQLPWEREEDAVRAVATLADRSPAELEALLARVERTRDFDQSVAWLADAGVGLPRALYESALLIYRDTRVLEWDGCLQLARLMAWAPPRFRPFELDRVIDLTERLPAHRR
jgi:hypothetical protein